MSGQKEENLMRVHVGSSRLLEGKGNNYGLFIDEQFCCRVVREAGPCLQLHFMITSVLPIPYQTMTITVI